MTFFYESQEKELMDAVSDLEAAVTEQEESGFLAEGPYMDDELEDEDDDDDDDDQPGTSPTREASWPTKRRRRRSSAGPRYVAG